jgi:hypothetical protein
MPLIANSSKSRMVWIESISQAKGMLHKWTNNAKSNIVSSTHVDTTTLALHVITGAGFGKKLDYNGVSKPGHGHQLSFKEAMETVLLRIVAVFLTSAIPTRLTNMLPDKLNPLLTIETAIKEFRQYLIEMVNEQRATLSERTQDQDTLVSALLRAADLEETQGKGKNTLSNDEIYGNLFIYSFAGHDTTANSLHYAFVLLADNEARQAWLKEEIRTVIGNKGNAAGCEYKDTFPKLKRCLAVMVSCCIEMKHLISRMLINKVRKLALVRTSHLTSSNHRHQSTIFGSQRQRIHHTATHNDYAKYYCNPHRPRGLGF